MTKAALIKSQKGNALTRNPARIEFAAECLRTMRYGAARDAIVKRWSIHHTTAERDLRAAKQLIALELDAIEVRAGEVVRNERIANRAEELAEKAASVGEFATAATLQRTAVAASREVSRLTGAYAPKEVKVTHGMDRETPLRLDAILAVLSEAGRAHLDALNAEIEELRAAGRLQPLEDPDVEDAEIVAGSDTSN